MFAQCSVQAASVLGVKAVPVRVEVVVANGLPAFTIVGMTDAAIQEARERIKAALHASGYTMPGGRITVNLAPGSLKKRGSGFDLPIAVALLVATAQIDKRYANCALYAGELSLNGDVRPVPGLLAYALQSREQGLPLICADSPELSVVSKMMKVQLVSSLADFRNGRFSAIKQGVYNESDTMLDFRDIAGHEQAKRAFQIAATGNHGLLMVGPPGSGKTMLASRFPSILPKLSDDELLEAATIHSIAGEPIERILARSRPFRAPHHSASSAGLIGGGTPVRPGEISLAHHGVLFLDELPEFKPSVLQSLRQPMESGRVTIVRAENSVELPARFSLIAAANPCPCGHFGDHEEPCTCSAHQINAYQNRIGGPILDRIDMRIMVNRLPPKSVLEAGTGTSSEQLLEGVMKGREYRSWRLSQQDNQPRTGKMLMESCNLSADAASYFEQMAEKRHLSGRAIARILNVSRTIADINQSKTVEKGALAEAAGLRFEEGKLS